MGGRAAPATGATELIALVHLVWGPFGTAPLRSFLDSYLRNAAGVDHELVILLNGTTEEQRRSIDHELDGVAHLVLQLEDPVLDLAAYDLAAARLEHDRLCFVNSYSVIEHPRWLSLLNDALDLPGSGLVGATGSWMGPRSWLLNRLRLPNPYRTLLPSSARGPGALVEVKAELAAERETGRGRAPEAQRHPLRVRAGVAAHAFEELARSMSFPNPHIRTNAFMLDRSLLRALRTSPVVTKLDARLIEAGKESLTRQVLALGLECLVVNASGSVFDPNRWPQSNTYHQDDQAGLLVSDNQTRIYARGSYERRKLLATLAWGAAASVTAPLEPAGS